jgi:flagellar FliL protein
MASATKQAKDEPVADTEDADGEAGPKKKLPLKLIIMAAAAVLVLGGGGLGAYLIFGGKKHMEEEHAAAPAKPVAFLDLPDVMVNLASSGSGSDRTQYLKIKIVLELPDDKMAALVQPLMPRVVDAFQTYLRELRVPDLEGSAGLYRLRDELTRRVNAAVSPARINAVLFKEVIVQ